MANAGWRPMRSLILASDSRWLWVVAPVINVISEINRSLQHEPMKEAIAMRHHPSRSYLPVVTASLVRVLTLSSSLLLRV